MLTTQANKLIFPLCAVLGLAYFTSFSQWEINFIIKNYLAVIPLQILALIYVFFYCQSKAKSAK